MTESQFLEELLVRVKKELPELKIFSEKEINITDKSLRNTEKSSAYHGQFEETKDKVVFKILSVPYKITEKEKRINDLIEEIKTINGLVFERHIPKFWGIFYGITSISSVPEFGTIFSFIEGPCLAEVLTNKNHEIFEKYSDKWNVCIDLVEIVEFLHSKNFIHRDINSNNIILNAKENNRPYLVELICESNFLDDSVNERSGNSYQNKRYAAPEEYLETKITEKFNIWSLGIIFVEIFSNEVPWMSFIKPNSIIMAHLNNFTSYKAKGKNWTPYENPASYYRYPKDFEGKFSELLKVTQACLQIDAEERCDTRTLKTLLKNL